MRVPRAGHLLISADRPVFCSSRSIERITRMASTSPTVADRPVARFRAPMSRGGRLDRTSRSSAPRSRGAPSSCPAAEMGGGDSQSVCKKWPHFGVLLVPSPQAACNKLPAVWLAHLRCRRTCLHRAEAARPCGFGSMQRAGELLALPKTLWRNAKCLGAPKASKPVRLESVPPNGRRCQSELINHV